MSGTAARPITVTSRTRKFSQYLLELTCTYATET